MKTDIGTLVLKWRFVRKADLYAKRSEGPVSALIGGWTDLPPPVLHERFLHELLSRILIVQRHEVINSQQTKYVSYCFCSASKPLVALSQGKI
jgi:hypothetical protein